MLKYTICFLQRGNEVLMLNRRKAPQMGVWNGVGGKLESGESPETCALREIYEETGISLESIEQKGMITWNGGGGDGMYAFVATLPLDYVYETPLLTREGILDWKPFEWLVDKNNRGVAEHIKRSLPLLLNDSKNYEHRCHFNDDGYIDGFDIIPLDPIYK